jgi:2-haloacid dehalogenase
MRSIDAVIFDLGGVLIDWNPEYLYSKIFSSPEEMRSFLSSVCTSDWNEQQDAGRPLAEGTRLLTSRFPHFEKEIRAYYDRWEEMLGGTIEGTVAILDELRRKGDLSLYALTNWSAETMPLARGRFPFLGWFDGMVVSGVEKTRKPFGEIYRLILDRYGLSGPRTLFIDDNPRNVRGAEEAGLRALQFISPERLRQTLREMELL